MKKWVITAIITTLVSLFAIPSYAHAFGRRCGGGGCCTPCYSSYTPCYTPVVREVVTEVVPVLAYPVLVPAFQFQYVPPTTLPTIPVVPVTGYPVATPIIQPAIPTAYGQPPPQPVYPQQPIPQMPYGQPAYPQYGQPTVPQQNLGLNNKDKIRELARALLEEMNRMAESGPVDSGPPVVPGTQPYQPQPQQTFQPPQQPQQPPPQQPNLAQFAVSAMSRTCAQCHTGVGSKGDMIIFNQPGLLNQSTNWKKIKDEIRSGRMPPKDTHFQLSAQEKTAIVDWLTSIGVN